MFRLAHLSDLHLGPLPPVPPRALLGKRLLGYLSWHTRRARTHRPEVLDALVRDLHATRPDHVVITGDLVNLALPEEFIGAAAWLRALGPPEWISVVPGNHDALVELAPGQSLDRWTAYMSSDDAVTGGAAGSVSDGASGAASDEASDTVGGGVADGAPLDAAVRARFPYLRRRGPLAILGLSSALATPPGLATGRLGAGQLARLEAMLGALEGDPVCRVVVLHHPPADGACVRRKRLVDAADLRRLLVRSGAEVVLHGHVHALARGELPGRGRPVQVFGAPSASSLDPRPEASAQYQIYAIERRPPGWHIEVETRRYLPAAARFAPAATRVGEPLGA